MKRLCAALLTLGLVVGLCGCSKTNISYSDTKTNNEDVIRVGVSTGLLGMGLYDDYYDSISSAYDHVEFMELSPQEQLEKYMAGEIDIALNLPMDQKKMIQNGEECVSLPMDTNVGVLINTDSDSFEGVKNISSLYQGLSICLDRVYGQEKVEGKSTSPIQTTFMKSNNYDAALSGVLNVEDGLDILENCGYHFDVAGDGTYNTNPEVIIPIEIVAGDEEALALAEAVKSDMDVFGFTVKIKSCSPEDYNALIEEKAYHMILTSENEVDEETGFIALWEKNFVALQKKNVSGLYANDQGQLCFDALQKN